MGRINVTFTIFEGPSGPNDEVQANVMWRTHHVCLYVYVCECVNVCS